MVKKCPQCKSLNVRRSAIRARHGEHRNFFLSPYRCRDCRNRFWVLSRNAYLLAGLAGAVLVGVVLGWAGWSSLGGHHADADAVAAASRHFDQLIKRAEKGDPEAEYGLARLYAYGDGVAKSGKNERKWLERAAGHGQAQAQYDLAIILRDGRGTIQDHERAWKLMRSAAEGGNPQAQYELGLMYRAGTGVPADATRAYVWLSFAAAQGVPGATSARDAVLSQLPTDEAAAAQAEARRLSEIHLKPSAEGQ